LCALLHLVLHWNWMVAMTRKIGTHNAGKKVAKTEGPGASVVHHE
jgi:hypothetical protein